MREKKHKEIKQEEKIEKTEEEKNISSVEWSAAEFEYKKKDAWWFVYVILGALALLGYAIWQRNFFFGIFVFLAVILIFMFANKRPETMIFRIDEEGVHIGKGIFIPYKSIEHFFVVEKEHALDEIYFKKRVMMMPYVSIRIDRETLEKAREVLQGHLQEVESKETMVDILSDISRF